MTGTDSSGQVVIAPGQRLSAAQTYDEYNATKGAQPVGCGSYTPPPRELKVSRSTVYTSKSDCEKDAKAEATASKAIGYVVETAMPANWHNQLAQLNTLAMPQQTTMWQYLIVR